MTNTEDRQRRVILQTIGRRAMTERRLLPDISGQAIAELDEILGLSQMLKS